MRFLLCLARAVAKNGFKILADAVPFGGALYDVAADAWKDYGEKRPEKQATAASLEASLAADLQALAQAPAAQVRQEVAVAVRDVVADQPPQVQRALTSYLTQVPSMIRRSLRRPADPGGTTVPANRAPRRAEDLLAFLPPRLPRFQPGDRPLPGVNWELEELLGVGGFGEVWKAHHPDLTGITAALKFCLDPEAGRTLRHEAAALNRVMQAGRHPGIVPLRQAYLDRDPICLEYEFVEGGDLCGLIQELHQSGKVAPVDVARWMLHLAATVRFAHQMKPPLVHRDLKPANILVQRGPDGSFSLRIADFGISGLAASQALDEAARTSTSRNSLLTTAVRGACTPLYASPQQMAGSPADPRDDVHALGVIWYQMLTGDLTRGRPSGKGWKRQLAAQGVADSQVDLLEGCMDDDPAERPADAGDFCGRLHALLQAGSTADTKKRTEPKQERRVEGPPREIVNKIGMKLVLVGPGKFLMGSPNNEEGRSADEGPQHEVQLTRPFYIGVYAVTQEEYQRVMGTNPSWFSATGSGKDDVRGMDTSRFPVEQVSWKDAVEFCRRLSEMPEEKRCGHVYHLPTEAEWEYACRGGANSSERFHFGDSLSPRDANFDKTVGRTTPVGSYPANAFGLFDMHGNVWEWCADWYGPYPSKTVKDPTGASTGSSRVLRGGSWHYDLGRYCRAAYRSHSDPGYCATTFGFRVVCVVPGMLSPRRAAAP